MNLINFPVNFIKKRRNQKQGYNYILLSEQYKTIKEIIKILLSIFIVLYCYYIGIHTYILCEDDYKLITVCTTNSEELQLTTTPNTWYKSIINDFLKTFTSKGKTINPKFFEIKSSINLIIPLEHNHCVVENSILNEIKSNHINNIISECEFYKNKTSSLEIQIFNTKRAYNDLVKDINDILKEMNNSSKKV